ncbi:MAG: ABC transporter permease [Polyangiaceae bacterium]
MGRVGLALLVQEFWDRARDRWVLTISALFALLCSAVTLYGKGADDAGTQLTGPSLVTLTSLLVPLVALVLGHDAVVGERERNTLGMLLSLPVSRFEVVLAKFAGRLLALLCSIALGLGAATAVAHGQSAVLLRLALPTSLLGASFLALGILISAVSRRQVTAASLVVVSWFCLVFFYDLGLLGLLIASDGGVSSQTVGWLVSVNPAGLFRTEMLRSFSGPGALEHLGMSSWGPGRTAEVLIWLGWSVLPIAISGLLMTREKELR